MNDGPTGPWSRGLLVSVRTADEARAALAGGAAIIDVKEPSRGPLGPASAAVTAAIVAAVAGRAPVTLACGELVDGVERVVLHLSDLRRRLPPTMAGPVAVKAGPRDLDAASWPDTFRRLAQALPAGVEAVAVAYADSIHARAAPPEAILAAARDAGAATMLIDTCDKAGPGLFATASPDMVDRWVVAAGRNGLRLALAGRLTADEVETALGLGSDVVGVRSAACAGGRGGRIEESLVARLAAVTRSRAGSPRSR